MRDSIRPAAQFYFGGIHSMSEENKTNAMEEKPESVQTEDKKETLQAKTGKKERKKG